MLPENMRYAFKSLSRSSDVFSIIKTGNFMISNFIGEKPTAQCFDVVCNKCAVYSLFDKLLLQFKTFELNILLSQWKKPLTKLYNNRKS